MTQGRLDFDVTPPAPERVRRAFYVRSHMRAEEAVAGERQANHQESEILSWWRKQEDSSPGVRFTPSQVWKALESLGPLTSIRRAMTTLAGGGRYRNGASSEVVKVEQQPLCHHPEERRQGLYGKPESTWGLRISCPTHSPFSSASDLEPTS